MTTIVNHRQNVEAFPPSSDKGVRMKSTITATAFLFAASLGLAACSNNNPNSAGDQQQQASTSSTSSGNPGAMDSNQPVSDTWITTKVKTELATTQGVESTDISVKTVNGVVTLTGVLASDVAVDKAVAAAKSVKGVKQVDASGLKSK
ncbi:MAG TPA: BON domain-containing protein [Rhodanobacteraceae bacterium]|nr:BON domain-containing protein [Rhodanobacteraceae bacterium]